MMSSQGEESESSSSSLAPNAEEFQENSGPHSSSGRLRVTFLASEWGSSKGGLSTVNRELAINVAKNPKVDVTVFVPRCNDDDKKVALGHKINLVKAIRRPGTDELAWLIRPPNDLQIDVVVGHGIKLGHQAQFIRESHQCKWVQVVHTAPEELGMYISVNEKKHEIEVELCEMADFVVTVGPKLTEAFRTYLRPSGKDKMVFEFTPGILAEFSEVEQVVDERKKFGVLVFGRGDNEDFELKGFDIAAKAVATLDDTHLTFVGASDGKQDEVKTRLLKCGIPSQRLTVRSFLQNRESLKNLLCEVDLAIMPSRTEGFGLTGLDALSAGLPILVSGNSGFGVALSNVPFGSFFVIDSEDSETWAKAIKDVRKKDRFNRLQESKGLRASYEEKYNWENQTKSLISNMVHITEDSSAASPNSTRKARLTQQTERMTERPPGTLPIVIKIDSVTFQKAKSRDPVQQEEAKLLIMNEMTKRFVETHSARVPVENYLLCLEYYLKGGLDLIVREAIEGSLQITVECSTLEILERLWKDYCSGHLNAVAEERLLTDDIKKRFDVESVKLQTTILKEDYLACKLFLMDMSKVKQDSALKDNESLPQEQTQAADETQTQTTEEAEPMTVHFAVNYRGNVTKTQTENCAQKEEGEESRQLLSEEETSDVPVDELPQYFQDLKLIHDPTPTEGSENNLRIAAKCSSLQGLERLWQVYRSGRLNAIAEKYLVTDDIKRRFHVESVNLATTILEEDYLACREFLSSNPLSNDSSPIKVHEEISVLAAGETSIQSGKETQTQIAVNRGTLTSEETQIQAAEESQSQVVDESEILTVEGTETQVTAETQIPSAEETNTRSLEATETRATGMSHIPSAEKIQTQVTSESTNLARDETQIQSPEETCTRTKTAEYMCTLATEDADIKFPEESQTENTEESEPSILDDGTKGSTLTCNDPLALSCQSLIQDPKETQIQAAEERSDTAERVLLGHPDPAVKFFGSALNIDAPGPHPSDEAFKINTTLTSLHLGREMIGDYDARSLSEALKVNNTLTYLLLCSNNIGDSGAGHLSEALKVNRTLTNLHVTSNNIGDSGAGHLSKALKVNRTLTNLEVRSNNIGDSGAGHLSEALKVNRTLTNLDVSFNNIGDSGAGHLSEALKVNGTLTNLDVRSNSFGDSGAGHLSEALKVNRTLTNLEVSLNNIGDSGAGHLSEALKVNRTLTNLEVNINNIGDSGAGHLSEALKVNRTLTNLEVRSNNIGDSGAGHLSEALKVNRTLTNLDVSSNNTGDSGAGHLSEALKVNRTLTNLDVSWNNIGDSGAGHLSEALKVNRTLTNLDVSSNNIGDSGAGHLSEALKVNRTLTNLDVSFNNIGDSGACNLNGLNVYCKVYSFSQLPKIEERTTLEPLERKKRGNLDSFAGEMAKVFPASVMLPTIYHFSQLGPIQDRQTMPEDEQGYLGSPAEQKEEVSEHEMMKMMTPFQTERSGSRMMEKGSQGRRFYTSHTRTEEAQSLLLGKTFRSRWLGLDMASPTIRHINDRQTTPGDKKGKSASQAEQKEEVSEHEMMKMMTPFPTERSGSRMMETGSQGKRPYPRYRRGEEALDQVKQLSQLRQTQDSRRLSDLDMVLPTIRHIKDRQTTPEDKQGNLGSQAEQKEEVS